MHERQMKRARIASSVAATVISLACGTNYVYSAWAPQFADKLHLSATESNLVGLAGNLGMYSMGVPVGMFIDHRARPAVIAGSILLGVGYFPLRQAYVAGSASVVALCFFSYLTGLGGCMAFQASIKTSAMNWPHHRGTATAFPLAAFGLSAFFFSVFGGLLFPGNTSDFLMLLACGTFGLTLGGFFFLRVLPHSTHYHAVHSGESAAGLSESQELRRTPSEEAKVGRGAQSALDVEPGQSCSPSPRYTASAQKSSQGQSSSEATADSQSPADQSRPADVEAGTATPALLEPDADANADVAVDESSSLMSKTSASHSSLPGDVLLSGGVDLDRSHRVDIRGWNLLRNFDFWQQWLIMGILSGIGLMTINNIGNDANALWRHYDSSVDENFLVRRQQMHVSILSVGSFAGRLLSGVGSDFLVKSLHASRVWCLVVASLIFTVAQILALNITNPHFLALVSGLSGLGYGFLFGVFPSIVAETFGVHGLSQNWGYMMLSPVVSSNVFNLFYGAVFDRHSVVKPDGQRTCSDGLECYWAAYLVTLGACGLGLVTTLWVIRHQRAQAEREGKAALRD